MPVPVSQPVRPIPAIPAPPAVDCTVDTTLECSTVDGQDCSSIRTPGTLACSEGVPLSVVQFSYSNSDCTESANSQPSAICMDEGLLMDQVSISCSTTSGDELVVSLDTVFTGGSFVVQTLGGEDLPALIECTITTLEGTLIQTNVIDVSGSTPLSLGDRFGALVVEGCNEWSCRSILCYGITVRNTGAVEMNVTRVDFLFGESVVDIAGNLQPYTLLPGEEAELEEKYEIDICRGGTASAAVNVEAVPPNGAICLDADRIDLSLVAVTAPPVMAPTQNDVCPFRLGFNCIITGNEINTGKACNAPDTGVVPCTDRPTAATMLFNGGGCEQSDNDQELRFNCTDFNGGPPDIVGEQVHILVTDAKGEGIVYFDGPVRVGDFYPLSDGGNRFDTDQIITIATFDRSMVLQQVQYHTSCANDLELKDRFGASQLVGFFNDAQGNVTCFSSFDLTLTLNMLSEAVSESIELTGLTVETNFAGELDLTSQVRGQVATPGSDVVLTLEGDLDLTSRRTYTVIYSLEGLLQPEGTVCAGNGRISFDAGNLEDSMFERRERYLRSALLPTVGHQ